MNFYGTKPPRKAFTIADRDRWLLTVSCATRAHPITGVMGTVLAQGYWFCSNCGIDVFTNAQVEIWLSPSDAFVDLVCDCQKVSRIPFWWLRDVSIPMPF